MRFISSLDACKPCNDAIYSQAKKLEHLLEDQVDKMGFKRASKEGALPFYKFFYSARPYYDKDDLYQGYQYKGKQILVSRYQKCGHSHSPARYEFFTCNKQKDCRTNRTGKEEYIVDCPIEGRDEYFLEYYYDFHYKVRYEGKEIYLHDLPYPPTVSYGPGPIYSYIALFEKKAPDYANIAYSYFKEGNYEEALKYYDQAIDNDRIEKRLPNQIYIDAAEANFRLKNYKKAIELYTIDSDKSYFEEKQNTGLAVKDSALFARAYYEDGDFLKAFERYYYEHSMYLCLNDRRFFMSSEDYIFAVLAALRVDRYEEAIKMAVEAKPFILKTADDHLNLGYIWATISQHKGGVSPYLNDAAAHFKFFIDSKWGVGSKLSFLPDMLNLMLETLNKVDAEAIYIRWVEVEILKSRTSRG